MNSVTALLSRRHWIFDLDGTLTVAAHDFDAIREQLGMQPGQPIVKSLSAMPHSQSEPLKKKLQSIEIKIAQNARPAPGAESLLDALKTLGCRIGLLTLNTRENAWITLQTLKIAHHFDESFVIGRWCAPPKPSPEGILKMVKQWGIHPEETVVVGDYLFDLQMGRAAGSGTIHVDLTGKSQWPELTDLHCISLNELRDRLKSTIGSAN